MVLDPPIERLHSALTGLVALERLIQRTAANLDEKVSAHSMARDLVAGLEEMACNHLDALYERLQVTPDQGPNEAAGVSEPPANPNKFAELHPISNALGAVYTVVREAIIGYSAILPIALRAHDSWVMSDESTTAHISRRHTQEYLGVAGQVAALIHDVVIWELEKDGLVCGCTCPSCSIGICVGAISSRSIFSEGLIAGRPPAAEHGVELKSPRPGSAAAEAGFVQGDVIVSIDVEKIDALPTLQRVIRDRNAGDWMELTVRRKTGETKVAVVHSREGTDINEDDCILPAGQRFYLDQARDVKRRLHRRGGAIPEDAVVNGAAKGATLSDLSAREIQVLRLVAQGATNPIITDELEISRATVARHVATILAKTGLANRTEAATLASQHGLLPDV
jgi:DNA-binding CsgD family transcriptional regulator